jgi:hypothetical protein
VDAQRIVNWNACAIFGGSGGRFDIGTNVLPLYLTKLQHFSFS